MDNKQSGIVLEADMDGGLEVVQASLKDLSNPAPDDESLTRQENEALALLAEYAQRKKNLYKKPVVEPGSAKFTVDHAGKVDDEPAPISPDPQPLDASSSHQ